MRLGRKKYVNIIIASICVFMAAGTVSVTAQAAKPNIISETACVIDVQSGAVLYEKNMNRKEYPASITKIMTTLVTLENCSLDEEVTYTDNAFSN